jgi:hypothetical protein
LLHAVKDAGVEHLDRWENFLIINKSHHL